MYNDGALRGFAEVFLRAGATGVLATAGAVGTEVAREMGVPVGTHELPVHVRAAESGAPSPPSEHVPVDAPAPAVGGPAGPEDMAGDLASGDEITVDLDISYDDLAEPSPVAGAPAAAVSPSPGITNPDSDYLD